MHETKTMLLAYWTKFKWRVHYMDWGALLDLGDAPTKNLDYSTKEDQRDLISHSVQN